MQEIKYSVVMVYDHADKEKRFMFHGVIMAYNEIQAKMFSNAIISEKIDKDEGYKVVYQSVIEAPEITQPFVTGSV